VLVEPAVEQEINMPPIDKNPEIKIAPIEEVIDQQPKVEVQNPDVNDSANVENSTQEIVENSTQEVAKLSLVYTAECWTEVFDATGKRIAFGLYKDGRVLSLAGVAPFQLKLGDPSVVEIQYQDQIIEGEFTPGRSAQFSVPLS
jgi:cytoskeleton protein RodZ